MRLFALANAVVAVALAAAPNVVAARNVRAQQLRSEVDEYMRASARAGKFSGAVLVARGGKVLVSRGYGMASLELGVPNTPRTKFRIGSLTKQFTAMAVMMLQERGKLSVQDSVCAHVPECPPAWAGVQIHHLLVHTSGLPELLSLPDFWKTAALPSPPAQTVGRFRHLPLEFKPGEKFKYSNSGYVLLGHIIERAAGQTYESFLRENIFAPLGMHDTGTDHGDLVIRNRAAGYVRRDGSLINAPYIDMSIPTGGGSLYSTTENLFLWAQALHAGKLANKNSYAVMFTPHATADWGDGAAYGWFTGQDKSNRRFMGFLGGINGFASQITRYPEEGVLVVVLSNYSFAPVAEIGAQLTAVTFGDKAALPARKSKPAGVTHPQHIVPAPKRRKARPNRRKRLILQPFSPLLLVA